MIYTIYSAWLSKKTLPNHYIITDERNTQDIKQTGLDKRLIVFTTLNNQSKGGLQRSVREKKKTPETYRDQQ